MEILFATLSLVYLRETLAMPNILLDYPDFPLMLHYNDVFVDKSLLIGEILANKNKVIGITRPRGWGKSMNLDMLRKFFEIEIDDYGVPLPHDKKNNHKAFLGEVIKSYSWSKHNIRGALKIAHSVDMLHQGKYPVIWVDFRMEGSNYTQIERGLKKEIRLLFWKHRYLVNCTKTGNDTTKKKVLSAAEQEKLNMYIKDSLFSYEDLVDGLRFLSELLFRYFEKEVIVLVDHYDESYTLNSLNPEYTFGEMNKVLDLFKNMYSRAFNQNLYVAKAILTGTLRLSEAVTKIFSFLHNCTEYTILDEEFSQFYGFTKKEVDEMWVKIPSPTIALEELHYWYNGFNFEKQTLYSPTSIMWCLKFDENKHYFTKIRLQQRQDYKELILMDEMQPNLQLLMTGGTVIQRVLPFMRFRAIHKPTPSSVLNFLFFTGYLDVKRCNDMYQFLIPNEEMKIFFKYKMETWVKDKMGLKTFPRRLVTFLISGQVKKFKQRWRYVFSNATNLDELEADELKVCYTSFMVSLTQELADNFTTELMDQDGVKGTALILVSKMSQNNGVVVIKFSTVDAKEDLESAANTALEGIKKEQYYDRMNKKAVIRTITKIGMAFWCRKMELKYETQIV